MGKPSSSPSSAMTLSLTFGDEDNDKRADVTLTLTEHPAGDDVKDIVHIRRTQNLADLLSMGEALRMAATIASTFGLARIASAARGLTWSSK